METHRLDADDSSVSDRDQDWHQVHEGRRQSEFSEPMEASEERPADIQDNREPILKQEDVQGDQQAQVREEERREQEVIQGDGEAPAHRGAQVHQEELQGTHEVGQQDRREQEDLRQSQREDRQHHEEVRQKDYRERQFQRSQEELPEGSLQEQPLHQGLRGSRGSQEQVPDLRFDVNMLKEDLREVMLKIRKHIAKPPSGSEALAIPTDCFGQRSLETASHRTDLDPKQHLSWILLGFNVQQDKYEGEPMAWIDPAEMRDEARNTCKLLLDSLKDFLGSRRGRTLTQALECLGHIGIAFLELAQDGKCAVGPLTGHHIMIHGQFVVDNSSSFGVRPDYTSIEEVHRPLYDGSCGLDAVLTELQAKSLGFIFLSHFNYSTEHQIL